MVVESGPVEQIDLINAAEPLRRADALVQLRALEGADLRPLADAYELTVWRDGKRNKGWAGQVVERFLGQRPNARHGADFGDWELKVVPLAFAGDGVWRLKETMAITMMHDLAARTPLAARPIARARARPDARPIPPTMCSKPCNCMVWGVAWHCVGSPGQPSA